ncbi:hypothetical protein HPB49_010344 [Dermacentor silvarum]|uniref:Uncharacterized protein n=1 Tax=Dermacentor silvarum TaxID=543639 RepID=A0ACB8C3A8_DERSI|nr:hypothetical protein HPB49_010344 [Dermacentor silvarum]
MQPILSSVLWDRHLLSVLSRGEIDDLMLSSEERRLLRGDDSLDDLEYELRRRREPELLRYRSRYGLLDVAVKRKRAPLHKLWGLIDETARPICRPKQNQESYYSGHKR